MAKHDDLWIPEADEKKLPGILLKTLIIVVAVVGIFFLVVRLDPAAPSDTERGLQRLKELEAGDVSVAEANIQTMRQQVSNAEEESTGESDTSMQIRFADNDILIMGDKLAMPLLNYGILDNTELVATEDATVDHPDTLLSSVYQQEPWEFVLAFGLNDVLTYGQDVEGFINSYMYIINEYHGMRPNSAMYICSIPEVTTDAIEKQPNFAYIKTYNEAIRRLCKKQKITYIELNDLVKQYNDDGILPTYDFYTAWADRVLEYVTGLTHNQATSSDTGESSDSGSEESSSDDGGDESYEDYDEDYEE